MKMRKWKKALSRSAANLRKAGRRGKRHDWMWHYADFLERVRIIKCLGPSYVKEER